MSAGNKLKELCFGLGALNVAAIFVVSCAPAEGAARHSGVYCVHDQDGTRIFADKIQPNGDLSFGLSVWAYNGSNIGLSGIASRHDDYWEYTDNLNAESSADRCRLKIVLTADGGANLTADPNAACKGGGGYRAEIGAVRFPKEAYEGPVTVELNDAETFFGKAGKCARF